MMRKAIIPFLFIMVFKNKLGLDSIWYGFTVAEIIAFIFAIILIYINYNKLKCIKNIK